MVLGCRTIENETPHEAGLALLAQLWDTHVGGEMPPIAKMPRGKPYFPDSPWHFSITHTSRHAFVVLSEHPVGIDAEEMDRPIRPELAKKILSPAELTRYEMAEDKRAALLKLWVLKEAWVKYTGEGLRGYPNHTDFDPEDPRIIEHSGCYVAIIEEEHHAL